MKKIIILAGTKQQFDSYCRVNELNMESAVYGHSFESIQGVEASKVEVIGTFWDRKDASELKELADSRIR